MKNLFLFFVVFVTTQSTLAQQRIGNGGDVVVCPTSAGTAIQLYDHYEAVAKFHLTLDLGSPTLTPEEKVDLLLNRIAQIDELRAAKYRAWYDTFFSEAEFIGGIDLIDIPDSDGYIPAGCVLKQVAVQRSPYFPTERRYTISNDLWQLMDNNARAGLILHELILRESVESGQLNSKLARYYNARVSARGFTNLRRRNYFEILKLVQFRLGSACGMWIDTLDDTEFYSNGNIRSGSGERGSDHSDLFTDFKLNSISFSVEGRTPRRFYDSSSNACSVQGFDWAYLKKEDEGYNYELNLRDPQFSISGVLQSAVIGDHPTILKFVYQGTRYFLDTYEHHPILLHSTGYPAEFATDLWRSKLEFGADENSGKLYFSESGRPVKYSYKVGGVAREYIFP